MAIMTPTELLKNHLSVHRQLYKKYATIAIEQGLADKTILENEAMQHDLDKFSDPIQKKGFKKRYFYKAHPNLRNLISKTDVLDIKKALLKHITTNRHHFDYHIRNTKNKISSLYLFNKNTVDIEAMKLIPVDVDKISLVLIAIDICAVSEQLNSTFKDLETWLELTLTTRYDLPDDQTKFLISNIKTLYRR